MYLVLAENEVNASDGYDWKDVTGERYHFPNAYVNKVIPGAEFIYYKGTRRADGTRSEPEYFGCGTFGSVYPDPEITHKKTWIAEIADYQEFPKAVPFRQPDGTYTELGSTAAAANRWGTGVRSIAPDIWKAIIFQAGLAPQIEASSIVEGTAKQAQSGTPVVSTLGLLWKPQPGSTGPSGKPNKTFDNRRLSKRAKAIGDEAERLFLDWIRSQESDLSKKEKIRWVAQAGETPGYDIEDCRQKTIHGFEVKGTTGRQFVAIDLTINELTCAKAMGSNYSLALVAGVFTATPKIVVVANPASLLASQKLVAEPIAFRVCFTGPTDE